MRKTLSPDLKPTSPISPAGQPGTAAVLGGASGACDGGGQPRLTLTREQMLEAQEMFSSANRVTRPEKALILGFMAGSRGETRGRRDSSGGRGGGLSVRVIRH